MPIHRHLASSETIVCLRGLLEEYLYDENGGADRDCRHEAW